MLELENYIILSLKNCIFFIKNQELLKLKKIPILNKDWDVFIIF